MRARAIKALEDHEALEDVEVLLVHKDQEAKLALTEAELV
jgi:hypothetical protein